MATRPGTVRKPKSHEVAGTFVSPRLRNEAERSLLLSPRDHSSHRASKWELPRSADVTLLSIANRRKTREVSSLDFEPRSVVLFRGGCRCAERRTRDWRRPAAPRHRWLGSR